MNAMDVNFRFSGKSRFKKGKSHNMVPVDVGLKDIDTTGGILLHDPIPERTEPCPAVEDQTVITLTNLHTGSISAECHRMGESKLIQISLYSGFVGQIDRSGVHKKIFNLPS
jgi:hypothetical protein